MHSNIKLTYKTPLFFIVVFMSVVEKKDMQISRVRQKKKRMKKSEIKNECKKEKLVLQYHYLVSTSHLALKGFK